MIAIPFSKRGLEAHFFVWIFAVVAGTLILLFFIRLSFQHKGTEDLLQERTIIFDFEQQLHALSTSESVSKILSFREPLSLQFDCTSVFGKSYRRTLSDFLFVPPSLHGNSFTLWTQAWEYPFPLATFYYLLDKKTKIVLIYDDQSASFVENIPFPPSFGISLLHVRDFDPASLSSSLSSFSRIHLVFFTSYRDISELFALFPSSPLFVIMADTFQHTLTIFGKDTELETSYFGDPLLFGSFFAPQSYSCLHDRAVERFFDFASLYEQKAGLLAGKLTSRPECKSLFLAAQTTLQNARQLRTPELISATAQTLIEQNKQLLSYDCPTLL